MNCCRPAVLTGLALAALPILAAVPQPTLGKQGRLLLEENFAGDAVPKGWAKNFGALAVSGGALRAGQQASDKHAAAFRRPLPVRDCAIQVDFKFAGATTFHLGFDPAPGELKKKGHLFSLVVTPTEWSILEHVDKADPKSKNAVRAKAAAGFPRDQWHTLLLEVKGETVVARVDGREALRASAKDFGVKKPGLVFRVMGQDGDAVLFDNLKVWALE
jgi:hypothetical protein